MKGKKKRKREWRNGRRKKGRKERSLRESYAWQLKSKPIAQS